jgi:LPS sulfotransferase NodH
VRELEDHDACWRTLFAARGITPVRLTYEAVAADPCWAVQTVLAALGLDTELASQAPIPTAKLADRVSQEWVERFRHDAGA